MHNKSLALTLLLATGLLGQTVESIPYRAVLSSGNETQQPANPVTGNVTLWLHVVRDTTDPANPKVVSGSFDAAVGYNFTSPATITAMHIHKGAAFANGGVVVPFAVARTDVDGKGVLPAAQTNFPSASVTLDTINGILSDPSQFYFNLHTTDAPGGVMRGQLQRAETAVRIGLMAPQNETPANPGPAWNAAGGVILLVTRDGAGAPNSAYAIFDVSYRGFTADTVFSGLHVHSGAALASGPVVIPSGLSAQVAAGGDGSGVLHYESEIDLNAAGAVDAVNGFIANPGAYYINLHTTAKPGGAVRGQLQAADRIEFQVPLTPDQEVPPVSLAASAPSKIIVHSIRNNADATIPAAVVIFDENPQFPTGTQFTATHIHNGVAGANGPVAIDSRLRTAPILTTDGTGNLFRMATTYDATGVAALNSLIVTPWKHYLNLHTSANSGGAVRAQLTAAPVTPPAIAAMYANVPYSSQIALAPGSNFVLTGTNLAFAGSDVSGFTGLQTLPLALNGVSITIGGVATPLSSVASGQITGQVPFEVAPGQRAVIVTNAAGASAIYNVMISAAAPGILYGPRGVVATRLTGGTAVTPSSPAAAGEVVVLTAVGLGQTSPPLSTGAFVGAASVFTGDIFARIGGVTASVPSVTALPGAPGMYKVTVVIPQGVASGNAPMMLQTGLITSNVVSIPIK